MQTVNGGVRRIVLNSVSSQLCKSSCAGSTSTLSLTGLSRQTASGSNTVMWSTKRHASYKSPLAWLRESLAPAMREKNTEEEIAAARKAEAEKGQSSVFDSLTTTTDEESRAVTTPQRPKKKHTHHKYSTANFKISRRKLNMLGRQIAGQPIDMAIMQMNFSEKRASTRIKSMLALAKDHAVAYKGLDVGKLVVAESWVTKGSIVKGVDIKGRGRMGVKVHADSRLHVILKEGKTKTELAQEARARKLKKIVSSGLVREDVPIRNPGPAWAW